QPPAATAKTPAPAMAPPHARRARPRDCCPRAQQSRSAPVFRAKPNECSSCEVNGPCMMRVRWNALSPSACSGRNDQHQISPHRSSDKVRLQLVDNYRTKVKLAVRHLLSRTGASGLEGRPMYGPSRRDLNPPAPFLVSGRIAALVLTAHIE